MFQSLGRRSAPRPTQPLIHPRSAALPAGPQRQKHLRVPNVNTSPQVRCSGPGLERARVGEKGEFFVDCTNAGPADLTIEIISDSGTEAEVHIQDNGDGTYTITYIPLYPGSYTLTIRYGGQDVPNFPARLNVEPAVDASGVRVFGPGVESKGRITLEVPLLPAAYCSHQALPPRCSHLLALRC